MGLAQEEILLVRATVSAPNPAERRYAESIVQRMDRWLTEVAVPHRVVEDEAILAGLGPEVRVVVLCHNPALPAAERNALKAFAGRGGKLMVFYGQDPDLAAALGFRLGQYVTSAGDCRWEGFRFRDGAPGYCPREVRQRSQNLRLVFPADSRARVIAAWVNPQGALLEEPAWLQSQSALWMTHILLDDGDTTAKKQMLLAMLAQWCPSIWPQAARRAQETSSTVGSFPDFGATVSGIRRMANESMQVESLLEDAVLAQGRVVTAMRQGRYGEAVVENLGLRESLFRAYGAAQSPKPGEFRGVWNHSGAGLYPGDWDRTCRLLAQNGFTDVFPNLLWAGVAHYPSAVVGGSDLLLRHGDQLAQCLGAARRYGLRVHVWKACWRMDRAPASVVERMTRQGRLQVTDSGETLPWLCPSNPENQRQEKDTVREILRNYAVDGIHLDYIRYPSSHSCYCNGCRVRFEKAVGIRVQNWPADVRAAPLRSRYDEWRCRQISRFVADVKALTAQLRPSAKVSAAVYGKYPSCRDSVAQDWPRWLKDGSVDFVCPMNYTDDAENFRSLVEAQIALPAASGKIIPGIGVTADESRLDPVQTIDQILIARKLGCRGFVLFELDGAVEFETLPVLRRGLTADRPAQPARATKGFWDWLRNL